MIWSQLRHRAWRTGALFTAVLLATTGFTVLTGTVNTARLQIVGDVDANLRGAYDILVRPKGARTAIEQQRGLVGPNHLSGTFGGITQAQYRAIQAIRGIEVAAPIANLGSVAVLRHVPVDLTDLVDRAKSRQLIRLDSAFLADRGLSSYRKAPSYVYVTTRPLLTPQNMQQDGGTLRYPDGSSRPDDPRCPLAPLEVQEDGTKQPICTTSVAQPGDGDAGEGAPGFAIVRLLPDGRFEPLGTTVGPQQWLVVPVVWWTVLGAAAVDPAAEARLVGLDEALVSGRYLTGTDAARPAEVGKNVPVLVADQSYVDESLRLAFSTVPDATVAGLPGTRGDVLRTRLAASTVTARGERLLDAVALRGDVSRFHGEALVAFNMLLQGGLPEYRTGPDGSLNPVAGAPDPTRWTGFYQVSGGRFPVFLNDTTFRSLNSVMRQEATIAADPVGVFDPGRLHGNSALGRVPLETYQAPEAAGADAASRELLRDRPLRPSGAPQGYLVSPPLLLTSLAALPGILGRDAAEKSISAVRVRVSDVHTLDEVTRERIRRTAEEIGAATGLDVDITVGSSLEPQTVVLPAGKLGRPELRLAELWSRKGVAVAIIEAVDRKSALLFGLILVVCLLFLANATTAAVHGRRRELAVLACVGWPRHRLAALVTGEVGLVGLAAGLAAAGLSVPLGAAAGVRITLAQSLPAAPLALLLALLAGLVPAIRAAGAHPGAALAPQASTVRRRRGARPSRTVLTTALRNARRRPGRTILATTAVALGVSAFTALLTLTWAFHGAVTGTLLGDAVSLRVRAVDTVAVAVTLALAALVLADVLYLNVRERAAELAALRAAGWGDGPLIRLVAYEGLAIGAVGAVLGTAAGVLFLDRLAGGIPPTAYAVCAVAALGGLALAGAAAVLPALSVRRLPLAMLLARE
ncbi:FtsX-like permease family protein [Catellatospora vulcania]|uniref:FtsX-like permease family protein n=1 Tax=Catellatospora vulcania TaxID=1460450 RepID=UPI0018AF6654|nr:FtsX-like permease family protein [Catellatospora vulcania]